MDKKTKIFAIAFALIAFIAVSTAVTYTNKEDALADLGKSIPQLFETGECKIYSVTENITETKLTGEIMVDYKFTYILDGEQKEEMEYITVTTTNQKDIENTIATQCDTKWEKVKTQAQNKKITTAHIDYTQGNLKGLLDKIYNVVTKTWK